jgi:hypothetical protein
MRVLTLHAELLLDIGGLVKCLLVVVIPYRNVCSRLGVCVGDREAYAGASSRNNGSPSLEREQRHEEPVSPR